jgi:hypothetical protein
MKKWSWRISTSTEVSVNIDITLDDILDFIDNCPKEYLEKIKSHLNPEKAPSLEEELKLKVFIEKTKHMSLAELEERLSPDDGPYLQIADCCCGHT